MYDIIIIGGGPSGLTAALYASRAGKKVALIEKSGLGGQIVYSPMVDNYPALPHISGQEYAERLAGQINALDSVDIIYTEATGINSGNRIFSVNCSDGVDRECLAVILATGTDSRRLGLKNEDSLIGNGVSYCAVCDGPFYAGRDVAVIGGGDSALQETLFLCGICKNIYLIHRRDEFRGEQRLASHVLACDNVTVFFNHTVDRLIEQDGILKGISLLDLKTALNQDLDVDCLFICIGSTPHSGAFASQVKVDDSGYYLADEDSVTSMPGVFAAGDARRKNIRQLTTAVGDGTVAAMAAVDYIDGLM